MKFTNRIPTLILLLLSFTLLSSCLQRVPGSEGQTTESDSETDAYPEDLEYTLEMPSQELQERFVNEYVAYQNYDPEDHSTIAIESWYGSFGDIHFLFVFDGQIDYSHAYWTDSVAESSFAYADGQSILVWVNKQFLTMKQAYEQNLITVDMIKTIENVYKGIDGSPIIMLEH